MVFLPLRKWQWAKQCLLLRAKQKISLKKIERWSTTDWSPNLCLSIIIWERTKFTSTKKPTRNRSKASFKSRSTGMHRLSCSVKILPMPICSSKIVEYRSMGGLQWISFLISKTPSKSNLIMKAKNWCAIYSRKIGTTTYQISKNKLCSTCGTRRCAVKWSYLATASTSSRSW